MNIELPLKSRASERIRKQLSACAKEHAMIEPGDRIMVGLSGGKDSFCLLFFLKQLAGRLPFKLDIMAVTVDGGLHGLNADQLKSYCADLDVPFFLEKQSIFETVAEKKDPGSTFCSLCAKMRRGALYALADRLGATKIALGHHMDDALETLMLNLFYNGRMAAMPPVLRSNRGHVPILRPLLYAAEADIEKWAEETQLKTLGCACPVCPTHPDHEFSDLKRFEVKKVLKSFRKTAPNMHQSARSALKNLRMSRFFDPSVVNQEDFVLDSESTEQRKLRWNF